MGETFEQFMARVDAYLVSVCGMSHSDFEDALWRDCYDENKNVSGPDFEAAVIDTLTSASDTFALIAETL